jgi:phenylpropionate dioxygenase-like ring-hydroxylating dioxygenase large terminal subunit
MKREFERLWPRVWNIGGWRAELSEPGDYLTHTLGSDSLLFVLQPDRSVKAFFNVCQHRGNLLMQSSSGHVEEVVCTYHGWKYGLNGRLNWVQDPDDFPRGGNPCGKRNLVEVRCEVFAGFIWYNLNPSCEPLKTYLGELWDIYASYRMEQMVRVYHAVCEVPFNWKNLRDNFCESYHLPATHPQLSEYFEDDYRNTIFEIYPSGHSTMRMKGGLTSPRAPCPTKIYPTLEYEMRRWDLDPKDFDGHPELVREALQRQIRRLGPSRGLKHVMNLRDDQLTDAFHTNLFPSTSITAVLNTVNFQRSEPHPSDPNKSIYDCWMLVYPMEGQREVLMETGAPVPLVEAPKEVVEYKKYDFGLAINQDLNVASSQQLGMRSRGFKEAYLTGQENRIHKFHDTINEYLSGKR